MGKTVALQDQNSTDPEYGVTDMGGTALITLNNSELSSEATHNVTVLGDLFTSQSELTCDSSGYAAPSTHRPIHLSLKAPQIPQDIDPLQVSISPSDPCAVLPAQVTAVYYGSISQGATYAYFYLDCWDQQLSCVSVIDWGNGTYSATLQWCPQVVGNHSIIVYFWHGSPMAQGFVAFDVDPCPDNLQMYTPQVVYGNQTQFSLVFTIPSPYDQTNDPLFSSFNTARTIVHGGIAYKLDQGTSSLVTLTINETSRQTVSVNDDGVACINISINMSSSHLTYVFAANTSDNSIYALSNLTRVVNYSKVDVSASAGANNDLTLGYSMGGGGNASQVYVEAESSVEASVDLFDMPVWNAPVNLTFAKFVPTGPTEYNRTSFNVQGASGVNASMASVTDGANFMRVACVYNNTDLRGDIGPYEFDKSPNWDASCDGIINLLDLNPISLNWQKLVKNGASPFADINHDGIVNLLDLTFVSLKLGHTGEYLPSVGVVAHFYDAQNGLMESDPLDSAGCIAVPAQARRVNFTLNGQAVGALVEFFNQSDLTKQSLTDTSGAVQFSWTPSEVGDYLADVKLPSTFSAVVSQNVSTSVHEPVCTVKYVQVVKRPVDLNVTCAPSGTRYSDEETVWFVGASCDTCIMGNVNVGNFPSYGIQSGMLGIGVAYSTSRVNQLFRTYIKFYVPPKHPDALFTSVYLMLYGFANVTITSGYMPPDENSRHYYAYVVTGPWDPSNLTWYNQPSYNLTSGVQGLDYDSDRFLVTSTTTEICFDITQAFQQWYNGAAQNFGLVIMDENESEPVIGQNWHGQWVWEAYSKEISGPLDQVPQLTTCYSRPTGYVTVMATDPVAGGAPIQNLSINGHMTDAMGEVSWPLCPSGLSPLGVLSGEYESSETAIYRAANISVTLDARYPTCLTSLNGSVVTGLPSGYSTNAMAFRLSCPSREENLTGVRVDFYVDPPNMNLWDFDPSYWADTDSSGVVWLSYEFSAGTHYIYALFDGYDNTLWQFEEFGQLHQYYYGDWYQPCNVSTVAVASVIPLGVDFSVSRQNFAPGAQLVLNATVIDLRYNDSRRYTQPPCNVNFTEINRYGIVTNHAVTSTSNGVALWRINYPSDGVGRAYKAVIVSAGDTPQNIISSPLQLTVGYDTTLLLSVTRDFNSTRHVFTCRLLSSGGSPVCGKNITLTLNSTSYITQQYPSLRTNASGYAWIAIYLSPQADNNQTVFNVVASFAGDGVSTATASMTLLNGTSYAVCTTTQYNTLKPSSNSTAITVMPQTTMGATLLMNMAQMQADAETKGLHVWGPDSWSIFPPFFKLHAKVAIDSLGVSVQNWVGLFACGVDSYLD